MSKSNTNSSSPHSQEDDIDVNERLKQTDEAAQSAKQSVKNSKAQQAEAEANFAIAKAEVERDNAISEATKKRDEDTRAGDVELAVLTDAWSKEVATQAANQAALKVAFGALRTAGLAVTEAIENSEPESPAVPAESPSKSGAHLRVALALADTTKCLEACVEAEKKVAASIVAIAKAKEDEIAGKTKRAGVQKQATQAHTLAVTNAKAAALEISAEEHEKIHEAWRRVTKDD